MQIELNFGRNEIYECGALLLSVLACPNESDEAKRAELGASLCGLAAWAKYQRAPDDLNPVRVKLQYVFREPKLMAREVNLVARRIGERMVAGRMAVPFFWRAERGDAISLPRRIKRLSVNQMAEFVLDDARQSDAGNLVKRIWAPSQPVIHLATAAASIAQQLKKAGQATCLELFIEDRWFIEAIIRQAETLEAVIAADPKFPVKADKLVRVRLN